jgi:hypothetical protein
MSRYLPLLLLLVLPFCASCQKQTATGAPKLSADELPTDEELRQMIDAALRFTYTQRRLNLDQHAAWQILHGALPFGMHYKVYNGDTEVGAVQWVLDGHHMNGWSARHGEKDLPHGRQGLQMLVESGSKTGQGHDDQWLAVLSQCGLPLDQKVIFQGDEYIMEDILQQAMWDVYPGKECSWTAIALTNYLEDIDTEWKASDGKTWTLEKIVAMEAEQNLNQSACGGSHRLIGMTMALKRYRSEGRKLTGGWAAADEVIKESIDTIRRFQQSDGSLSTNYLLRAGTSADLALRINTTGHTLEFLALALDDKQLKEPWVTHAVVALCELFEQTKAVNLECGSLYHATHGLIEYYERRFGPWQYPDEPVAEEESSDDADPVTTGLADRK